MDRSVVYWLVSEDLPEGAGDGAETPFLAPVERQRLAGMRFPKRRLEWLHGRLTAKKLAQQVSPELARLDPTEISILNEPEGAPYLAAAGQGRLPGCLSISHRDRVAFCALTFAPAVRLGADVERVEPRAAVFVEDFFTQREVDVIGRLAPEQRDVWVAAAWSAKEAVLKALGVGLRIDTRKVEVLGLGGVEGGSNGWQPVVIEMAVCSEGVWSTWWQLRGEYVFTLAVMGDTFRFEEVGL